MNKVLTSLILLSILVMVPAGSLLAQTEELEEIVSTPGDILVIIETFADWLFSALIILASLFIVWGGFEYITAGGDDIKITSARSKIKNALIGVVIAISAQGLVAVVRSILES